MDRCLEAAEECASGLANTAFVKVGTAVWGIPQAPDWVPVPGSVCLLASGSLDIVVRCLPACLPSCRLRAPCLAAPC